MADIQALDSRAVLGLLAKAHQMFTDDDTSLSFPIGTPLAFEAVELVEAMGPAPDAVRHALLAEFSTVMNLIPDGVIWPPSNYTGLDDVVREIVGQGVWAVAERTPAEEARFAAAQAQIDLHNPEMAGYSSLKDAWIRARERVANTPDDPSAKEAERSAHAELLAHPARTRIEEAMQDLVALDERAPHRARERFEQIISQGAGTFSDPSGGTFSPVRLLPRAVLTSAGWDSVTLDRTALDELAASAPKELTDRLRPPTGGDDPVQAITFEYASALLHRSWFEDAILKLRCWRFPDPDRVLSDGKQPPSGECPVYVCGVVLARNVNVTTVAPPATTADLPDVSSEALGLILPLGTDSDSDGLTDRFTPIHRIPLDTDSDSVTDELTRVQPLMVDAIASEGFFVEAIQAPDFTLLEPDFVPPPPAPPPEPDPEPEPSAADLVTQSTPAGAVIVLALICKAVQKAPDPSPESAWP